MGVWERFEGIASAEEVLASAYSRKPLKEGTYRMILKKIGFGESKNGLPMLKGEFRLVDGGRIVYYNQNLQNPNYPDMSADNIGRAMLFISGLSGKSLEEVIADVDDVLGELETETEHEIKVSYGKKDVEKKYPVLEVVVPEESEEVEDYSEF